MLESILESYQDEEFLKADGLDEAIIGVDAQSDPMRLIYSVQKCIEIFMGDGMSYEDALEYFNYNTRDTYMGEKTPIWCDDDF